MRTIRVPAGIGDNIWLIQKLLGSGERFRFRLAGDLPQRGKQIFDLIPQLSAEAAYDGFTSAQPVERNIQASRRHWREIREEDFFLSANRHLERGLRLEWFLPDLPTAFRAPWETASHREEAERLLPPGPRYVGLYGSTYSMLRNWSFWNPSAWNDLAKEIWRRHPSSVFVVFGASFDTDFTRDLLAILASHQLASVPVVGRPLALVVEAMKRLSYFFSFPSGLGILAPTVGCPTLMFYPRQLDRMIGAWAEPEAILSGDYVGMVFPTTDEALKTAREEGSLDRRLSS